MKSTKASILFVVLLLMLVPGCEQMFNFFEIKKLNGSFQSAELPKFNPKDWLSGNFQHKMTAWQNENFGFRNILVRLRNQIGFSLYKKSYANCVVVGKNDFLLDQTYIDAYNGKDFVGENEIEKRVQNFELLAQKLKERNKHLIIVLAPGKASFYHEYIPDKDLKALSQTNHSTFLKELKNSNLHFIDFKSWFDTLKPTHPYTLFPKNGIHWSSYGALIAADSLTKKISDVLGYKIPNAIIENVEWKNELIEVDQDVGLGMNLLFGPKNDPMPYPTFDFKKIDNSKKPNVLMVGDSYCWTFPLGYLKDNCFESFNYAYYNQELHELGKNAVPMAEVDLNALLEKTDLVILLSTDANLDEFDWNFSSQALETYTKQKANLLAETIKNIEADSTWFALVKQKALDKKISVDSMLTLDALHVLNSMNQ